METIIPSASSFAAAGLAAWWTVRGVRHQANTQHALAAGTQAAQRESEARAARRQAYARFIYAAVRTAGLLVRMSEAGITEDEYRDRREGAQQALDEVIEHEAIVSVEGPAGVALAAAQARRSLDHELAVILAHRQAQGSREAVEQAGVPDWRRSGE
ncbi:hypothetical protein [Streptomyces sp. WM6368]|uniref:hypothetical protein n=1 Tax=Streptomyces sp. WM6368 TaxID=1415554 RepID=UPI00131E532C|nr:hypothetical protein [Streptomyces sp. WM6368]